jgi:hypothetical protein
MMMMEASHIEGRSKMEPEGKASHIEGHMEGRSKMEPEGSSLLSRLSRLRTDNVLSPSQRSHSSKNDDDSSSHISATPTPAWIKKLYKTPPSRHIPRTPDLADDDEIGTPGEEIGGTPTTKAAHGTQAMTPDFFQQLSVIDTAVIYSQEKAKPLHSSHRIHARALDGRFGSSPHVLDYPSSSSNGDGFDDATNTAPISIAPASVALSEASGSAKSSEETNSVDESFSSAHESTANQQENMKSPLSPNAADEEKIGPATLLPYSPKNSYIGQVEIDVSAHEIDTSVWGKKLNVVKPGNSTFLGYRVIQNQAEKVKERIALAKKLKERESVEDDEKSLEEELDSVDLAALFGFGPNHGNDNASAKSTIIENSMTAFFAAIPDSEEETNTEYVSSVQKEILSAPEGSKSGSDSDNSSSSDGISAPADAVTKPSPVGIPLKTSRLDTDSDSDDNSSSSDSSDD